MTKWRTIVITQRVDLKPEEKWTRLSLAMVNSTCPLPRDKIVIEGFAAQET